MGKEKFSYKSAKTVCAEGMSFPDFTRHFFLLLSETVDSFFYAILIQ